jgi:hypothetical protein
VFHTHYDYSFVTDGYDCVAYSAALLFSSKGYLYSLWIDVQRVAAVSDRYLPPVMDGFVSQFGAIIEPALFCVLDVDQSKYK